MSVNPRYHSVSRVMLTADEESALLTDWRDNKSQKALTKIVESFSPIVMRCSKKYAGYGLPQEDLISEGKLGLVEAAHRFDPTLGFKFATYAWSWVEGLILAYVAKNYFIVGVCKSAKSKSLFFNLRKIVNSLHGNLDASDGTEFYQKIADMVGVDIHEVESMYAMFTTPTVGSEVQNTGDGDDFYDTIIVDPGENPEEALISIGEVRFHKRILDRAIKKVLTNREEMIFRARLMTDSQEQRTLQDIADELNLSKERIRQICDKAFDKVKECMITNTSQDIRGSLF